MKSLFFAIAALAIAGCHKEPAATLNETVPNVSTVDANAMPEDANITDVPPDDGDAPADEPAQAKHAKTTTSKTTVKTEHK